jgi:endonuclease/exonuclease/phosphatase family metal-dependent hydrolase
MTDWSEIPRTTLVNRLTAVPPEDRQALRQGVFNKAEHDRWFDAIPCLRQIETGGATPSRKGVEGAARVVFWNVERLRHLDAIADSLREAAPDVMLLCEIDRGMARSDNSDRVVEIAAELGVGYTYAVEFVELDLGDVHEQATHAGAVNLDGLHGAAILSDVALGKPFLIRIDRRGNWFGLDRHEPRVGGRIAIGAMVNVAGVPVAMVNVHLESHEDPMARAGDMARLLAQVDLVAGGGPVILGGDFNTSTGSYAERRQSPEMWQAKIAADPMRLLRPMSHEPLFAVAANFGYDWLACNVTDVATTRYPAGSTRLPAKIDWFFTRGLVASAPTVIPALCPDGSPSSDHDGLLVTVRPV